MGPPSPPPAPSAWYPSAPRQTPLPGILIAFVVGAVVLFVFASFVVSAFGGSSFFGFLPLFFCLPVLLILIFVIVALARFWSSSRRTIPPPPPIQQPMVPAGQRAPVAVDCPNCGGPPANVDRFGIAICSYCGTRFLVR